RISVIDRDGNIAARLGGRGPGLAPTDLFAPHGIGVDSLGNIFLGEVTAATWRHYFPRKPCPADIKPFRKLTSVLVGSICITTHPSPHQICFLTLHVMLSFPLRPGSIGYRHLERTSHG